ncbi:sigma-70 family RNA polymerase sigma factor [Thermomonas sp. S9]|uniref:sigma-70 family RNA polymerase sigma factor n=1 Tax=Thermomonas sp. S9 TaxID=2885203 RepID=UPI00216B4692|nr:sigma-70 family RNA polymerase sigma factor [Thermomonas sp. S9]MCR6494979.1 sigma-70 family RNA polymerase sigma factor [Thermomonas sp. S9]
MDAEEQARALEEALPSLRRFARALCKDAADADDLVQATLERALAGWRGRRAQALQPWLFAILYRRFLDECRRQARWSRWRQLFAAGGGADDDHVPSPEQVHAGREQLAAFSRLPAEQRAVLVLVVVEGVGYREAAAALGIPVGTVMSRLARARARLRAFAEEPPAAGRNLRSVL